jgi:hypothetical protein
MPVREELTTTPEDVAQWMIDELEKTGQLYQWEAILEIQSRFGDDFTYLNESGNFAIDRRVLRAFRTGAEDTVVWRRTEGCWATRGPHDPPGRQAAHKNKVSKASPSEGDRSVNRRPVEAG